MSICDEDQRAPSRADDYGVRATLGDGSDVRASRWSGRKDAVRRRARAAGLNVARWSYDHVALVTSIGHERSHENVAYEIFYPEGPFAILPLVDDDRGHRSAIVWSVRGAQAPGMQKLGERGYLAELERKMGGFLGELTWLGPRFAHPLGFHHAAMITADRLRWSATPRTASPDRGQGVMSVSRRVARVEVLVDGKRIGPTRAIPRCSSATALAQPRHVHGHLATDGCSAFGIPGGPRTRCAARRSVVQRAPRSRIDFISEARGESGSLPKLLAGLTV